jgi:hypothetical protein
MNSLLHKILTISNDILHILKSTNDNESNIIYKLNWIGGGTYHPEIYCKLYCGLYPIYVFQTLYNSNYQHIYDNIFSDENRHLLREVQENATSIIHTCVNSHSNHRVSRPIHPELQLLIQKIGSKNINDIDISDQTDILNFAKNLCWIN